MNVGNHIGQYRILEKIGAGGMGTVFLGEHILLGRRAAIKTLLPALSVNPEIVDRFFTEARATSAITDHGVVQIFDFGYHVDGTAYIVMELLEGESLQTRIERLGTLAPSDALRIARQVAASLAAAHEHGIVHRDLKPENIYLIHDAEAQGGERTKILDFGICKLGHEPGDVSLTQSGMTMGTPVYMSPEQCRGAGLVDQRSDIYALGCVLFHMVAGRPPFEREGAGEFIVAHLQEAPPAPSTFIAGLPDLVDGLVLRCLEKSADDRFQSMTELQHALEYVLARISASHIAVPAVPPVMPIAPGFRSSIDRRLPSPMPTQNLGRPGEHKAPAARRRKSNSTKSRPVSTGAGTPSGVRVADVVPSSGGDWFMDPEANADVDPRATLQRPRSRAAIAIVVFGLVAAVVATWIGTRGDEAVASPERAELVPVTSRTAPDAAVAAPAVAPVEPVPPAAPAAHLVTVAPATIDSALGTAATTAAATTAARTAVRTKVTTKLSAQAKATPQRRPSARTSPSSAATTTTPKPAPPEDLYDTR